MEAFWQQACAELQIWRQRRLLHHLIPLCPEENDWQVGCAFLVPYLTWRDTLPPPRPRDRIADAMKMGRMGM